MADTTETKPAATEPTVLATEPEAKETTTAPAVSSNST